MCECHYRLLEEYINADTRSRESNRINATDMSINLSIDHKSYQLMFNCKFYKVHCAPDAQFSHNIFAMNTYRLIADI